MLLKGGTKANPTKGRSSMRRPAKAATKGPELARARAKLAEKRVQGARKAKGRSTTRAPKPKAMSLAQMVEHNRRTAAMPASSKPVRPIRRATKPKVQENPMSKPLSAAQKKALAQGRQKLAKMRKTGSKPKSKPRSAPKRKTSGKKRKLSSKQLAALAKGRKAAAAKRAAAAKKPTSKRKPAARKPAARKASGTTTKPRRKSGVPQARKSIARAQRALAPAKRPRKPGTKPPKSIHGGSYTNKKGQTIVVRRTYNKRNPVVEFKQVALAGGGLALGWIAAEFADRYVATRAPKDAGDDVKCLYGADAIAAIQKPADATRMMVSGGGTLAFGLGAFALKDRAPDVAYALGGVGAGFGVKFFSQLIGDLILPAIFKVDKEKEGWAESYSNRLFPDKQKEEEKALPAGNGNGTRVGGWGNWGPQRRVFYPGAMGAPRQQATPYPFVEAPAQQPHVGPVATGAVAGCSSCGGAALSANLNDIFPSPKGGGCSCGGGCQTCGTGKYPQYGDPCPHCAPAPAPVAPPVVQPVDPGMPIPVQPDVPPYDPGFRKDLSIVEQPPLVVQRVPPTPPSIQPYTPDNGREEQPDGSMLVYAARGITGEPKEQPAPEPAAEPQPQAQGVSGTAAVMSMVGRRRRAR
jgi:hypothetical protein